MKSALLPLDFSVVFTWGFRLFRNHIVFRFAALDLPDPYFYPLRVYAFTSLTLVELALARSRREREPNAGSLPIGTRLPTRLAPGYTGRRSIRAVAECETLALSLHSRRVTTPEGIIMSDCVSLVPPQSVSCKPDVLFVIISREGR